MLGVPTDVDAGSLPCCGPLPKRGLDLGRSWAYFSRSSRLSPLLPKRTRPTSPEAVGQLLAKRPLSARLLSLPAGGSGAGASLVPALASPPAERAAAGRPGGRPWPEAEAEAPRRAALAGRPGGRAALAGRTSWEVSPALAGPHKVSPTCVQVRYDRGRRTAGPERERERYERDGDR